MSAEGQLEAEQQQRLAAEKARQQEQLAPKNPQVPHRPPSQPHPQARRGRVKHAWNASEGAQPGDLILEKGAIIEILSDGTDDGCDEGVIVGAELGVLDGI